MNKESVKTFIISAAHSFIAAFGIAALPLLGNFSLNNLTQDSIKGFILGILIVGFRSGSKALWPYIVKVFDYVVSGIVDKIYK